ncbi:5-oxoprolinase-like [Macrosteles quadrilineatus]|uniref:5-oxoprolinase-like n=1 Tax=Macrosteles quadrilineatus TaxID=74068 RepID=UPI0023E28E56|nr:5-oxoprolinase-like [Macrosteles quadrilineatus]
MSGKFKFAIDRGGTFTDIYAQCPNGKIRVMKLLSVDPDNYPDAPREGIRRILEEETGILMPSSEKIDGSLIEWIRMGTTVATNALLERKGERMALLVTKGFKDVLFIGNQARPKIFDLEIVMPGVLYEEVIEVDCRVIPALDDKCQLKHQYPRVVGKTGEPFLITKTLNENELLKQLAELRERGIKSLAVVLMHSYTCVEDELLVGKLADQSGFDHVSLSHQIMPMVRIVPRGFTACADAYLTPHIKKYVQGFASGFKDELKGVNVLFMQSDGGLTPMDMFNGSRAVLSGPAGGVVGYAVTTPGPDPVIGFDMGGTSTDVSRYAGTYEHVFESTTAGVTIQAPQLDVNTVAAGGGSCLFFRSGLFVVGPESAGAHPGPVCYCKGGPLTVTDANLVLGRLLPHYFPKIFGPEGKRPLDKDATVREFTKLTQEINKFLETQKHSPELMTVEEVAMGFIRVANEAMCRPIRALTQAKGYDTQQHTLACFGGAGAQHACAVARALGMTRVAIHKYAGILSAFGMACADVVQEAQVPAAKTYQPDSFPYLDEQLTALAGQCASKLKAQGFSATQIVTEPYLHLRYAGTDCALMCGPAQDSDSPATKHGDFEKTFLDRYQSEFGFTIPDRTIVVDDIRVRGIGKSLTRPDYQIEKAFEPPAVDTTTAVYFEGHGYTATPVYLMSGLRGGHQIAGPAVIMDQLSTILVEPDCSASVTDSGDLIIHIGSGQRKLIGTDLDPIQLSIFSHRFMSIAEQMGRVLQRTSISTNIKERLDFSCALFGPDGGLVSNAPHIPVHLGAMQETVQYQMKVVGDNFKEGDVILSNHPKAGGSHLPDLTVITPVFYKTVDKPVFFVASRGHHADIGGITPGSMPPHSKSLQEEGATFKSFMLVKQGRFCEAEVTEALMAPGKIPGSSGTRNLKDNLSDLKAQIAANQKGINLMRELIDFYGLEVVQAYMGHIQHNAELAVRDMLRDIARATPGHQLTATEYLDDGSPISLTVTLDEQSGSAVCDFSGTGPEVWGNCNAPRAITLSALIYCLRCMVGRDVPLNQGCLNPVKTVIPVGSLLDPSDNAGVVGGNVQTSQRIVDVVFKAFKTCAASQGCMNNVTFGQEGWGYYETVAGGAGAGPDWHGRSGVHTHMTNTRITDPEVLEVRYPVELQRFSLRPGSGGGGRYRGGDGVIRELRFRASMTLSILTERRVFSPYGLEGGMPGAKGLNLMIKSDGRVIYLGSKTAINVEPGDVFQLLTPGGGGWGEGDGDESVPPTKTPKFLERGSVFEYRKAQESV